MERETATIAPPGANVDAREADQSRFSTIAARVDNLLAVALSIPDLRVARVQALKAQIKAGTYQVPAQQVAAALLDHMRAPGESGGHRQSFGA
jgi:flagellar biosynthesis anti-sigma factor FlgM